jgi:hypothetical protein
MFVLRCGLFGCVPLTFQMNGDVRSMHLITHVHEKNSYASCLYPFRVTCVYVKRWVYKQYFFFLFHRKLQFVYLYILKWNLYGYNNTEQRIVSEKYFCDYFNSLVRKMHRVDGIIKQMNLIIHVPFLWSLVTVLHNTCDCKCSLYCSGVHMRALLFFIQLWPWYSLLPTHMLLQMESNVSKHITLQIYCTDPWIVFSCRTHPL